MSAWEDFWLPSGPLRNQVDGLLAEGKNMLSVKSLLNNMRAFLLVSLIGLCEKLKASSLLQTQTRRTF